MNRVFQFWLILGLAMALACSDVAVAAPGALPVASLAELEEALDKARGKPALVRIRADWNASGKELDKQFASACLQNALSGIAWMEWDVTANTDADRQFLEKYDVFGPPAFLLFDTNGNYLEGQDIVGYLPAERFVATLAQAFDLHTSSDFADCSEKEDAAKAQSWDELVRTSYEYLYDRQEALDAEFGLSEHDRWDIDQDAGTLTFSNGEVPIAEANIAIVGTLITAHGAWRWSWGNPSVDPKLSAPIDVVRQYGIERRLEKLTDRGWPAEEVHGWEMAAIANYLLKGKGVCRAPAGELLVFVVIIDIRKVE